MSIWEDVYSKHKKGDPRGDAAAPKAGEDQQPRPKQNLPEFLDQFQKPSGFVSQEEVYYQNCRPQPVSKDAPEPAAKEPPIQEPAPEPQTIDHAAKARFIPRIKSGKLTTLYPSLLSKMRYNLSDSWANIMLETKQGVRTLLVCGAARKEGVTLISYHLAMYLSKEYSIKVLYVDTNLNHAAVPKIQNLRGVYSFVAENRDIASLVVQTDYPGFYLLPSGAGTIAPNISANMLSREPIERLMEFCRTHFDITIIDGQPLVSSPSMIEFARVVDMTLLVCRYGYSRYEVSKLAVDKLQKFGIASIGVILNDRKYPVPQKLYNLLG